MVTIGGLLQSNYTDTWCDWEYMGVAIFEMSNFIWGSVCDATAAPYTVFSNISSAIGGDPSGKATLLLPDSGWSSLQLATVMTGSANQTAPVPQSLYPSTTTTTTTRPTTTNPNPKQKSS